MKLLFLGHSLIAFNNWQERFPGHEVASLGVPGETVDGMLSRIDEIKAGHPLFDLIFIMSGLNDVAMGDNDFIGDYREAVRRLKGAYPAARIYVNSILPTLTAFIPDSWIRKANKQLKAIAEENGAEYLDIYSLFIDENGVPVREYLLGDEVHLSDRGYDVWSAALEKVIAGSGSL
jgi:lysophospholipase L1-like esterase